MRGLQGGERPLPAPQSPPPPNATALSLPLSLSSAPPSALPQWRPASGHGVFTPAPQQTVLLQLLSRAARISSPLQTAFPKNSPHILHHMKFYKAVPFRFVFFNVYFFNLYFPVTLSLRIDEEPLLCHAYSPSEAKKKNQTTNQ